MKNVMPDELRSLVSRVLQTAGVPENDSLVVSDCLVRANLRGVESHGVLRVPHYVKRLRMGSINPRPAMTFERTGASTGVLDGDDGLGHVNMHRAMKHAIELAGEAGTGFVGVVNSSHCGALSYFGLQAVEAQMIGMGFSQTDKCVVPFGGREPFFGTNPMCFAVPVRSGPPIVLDMATSTVALGQIIKVRGTGKQIPDGWAVDADGNPTRDPDAARWLSPAAGPKGSALGMIVDVLTGVLMGGAFGPHVGLMYSDLDKKRKLCHLAGAINPAGFPGSDTFLDVAARMVAELHQVPAAEGFERVLSPGEPEYIKEAERSTAGIPLEDAVWGELAELLAGA